MRRTHHIAEHILQTNRREIPWRYTEEKFSYADLSPVVGSEQGGVRPVLIVQKRDRQPAQPHRDRGSHYGPAGQDPPAHPHQHPAADTGLAKDSVVLLEQIPHAGEHRLGVRRQLPPPTRRVESLDVSLGLSPHGKKQAERLFIISHTGASADAPVSHFHGKGFVKPHL